jgi:hypothetical protein
MNITKLLTKKVILKIPAIALILLSGLTLITTPARSQTRLTQEIINDWTDILFYRANPQLAKRQLRPNETDLIREWNAIQQIVPDILLYENIICGNGEGWTLEDFDLEPFDRQAFDRYPPNDRKVIFSSELNQVADAIFYARNPELSGQRLQSNNSRLANEWLRIRTSISILDPCY